MHHLAGCGQLVKMFITLHLDQILHIYLSLYCPYMACKIAEHHFDWSRILVKMLMILEPHGIF